MKRLAFFGLGALALIMPGAAAAQASLATLKTAPSASAEDYPRQAIMAEVEGSVVVEIAVDPTGAPTDCTPIEIRPPHFGFEKATCKILMQRARFSPARNASGVAIPGTLRVQQDWVIDEQETEQPAPSIAPPNPVPRTTSQYANSHPPFQCQTPVTSQTDFIWEIDKALKHMTNLSDGSKYTISDIRGSGGGQERIMAHLYTPSYSIEVDLFITLAYDEVEDVPPTVTVHRQVLSVGGPLGSGQPRQRYDGRCWPFRG